MNDFNQNFAHLICNIITKVLEQNSITSSKIKFDHGYNFDGTGCTYLRFFNWPNKHGKKEIVEIKYPSSFCHYDRNTGTLTFSPFENLFFTMNSKGYSNAHIWGSDGRLCRGGVLIEQPFALVESILSVLLQKNTTEESLKLGRPCPDSTLKGKSETVEDWLAEAKKYQNIIKKHFQLRPELFVQKDYFIIVGNQKIKLEKNVENLISRFLNSMNINHSRR